jgi:hypothetical protein
MAATAVTAAAAAAPATAGIAALLPLLDDFPPEATAPKALSELHACV